MRTEAAFESTPVSASREAQVQVVAIGPTSGDIAEWIGGTLRREEASCRRLIRAYTPLMMGYLLGKTRDPDTAEDIAQDAWMRALGSLSSLRNPEGFASWLLVIARRCWIDQQRSRRERWWRGAQPLESAMPVAVGGGSPAEELSRRQTRSAVLAAIGGLGERYRTVVYLRLIYEEQPCAIARRMGLKESTVRMRLKRGLSQLRERLEAKGSLD